MPPDSPLDAANDVRALVEVLLAARPAAADDRFDHELDAALAAGRIDPETARALRYRQRSSVRALETYLQVTLDAVIGAIGAAQTQAVADVDADDRSWQQAQLIIRLSDAARSEPPAAPIARLAVVPDLVAESAAPATTIRERTADETKAAIRAALQSS